MEIEIPSPSVFLRPSPILSANVPTPKKPKSRGTTSKPPVKVVAALASRNNNVVKGGIEKPKQSKSRNGQSRRFHLNERMLCEQISQALRNCVKCVIVHCYIAMCLSRNCNFVVRIVVLCRLSVLSLFSLMHSEMLIVLNRLYDMQKETTEMRRDKAYLRTM